MFTRYWSGYSIVRSRFGFHSTGFAPLGMTLSTLAPSVLTASAAVAASAGDSGPIRGTADGLGRWGGGGRAEAKSDDATGRDVGGVGVVSGSFGAGATDTDAGVADVSPFNIGSLFPATSGLVGTGRLSKSRAQAPSSATISVASWASSIPMARSAARIGSTGGSCTNGAAKSVSP